MSHLSFDPKASHSLAILVETVISKLLIDHPSAVCLEVDIDPDLPVPASGSDTCELVQTIVKQVIAELPPTGADLMVSACETAAGIELEVADNGEAIQNRSRSMPMVAARIGATLQWQNCPQGGAAVTMTFPRQSQQQSRAA